MTPPITFYDCSIDRKLDFIWQQLITNGENIVALQDQINTLTARVSTVEEALVNLGQKVDAEQVQIQAAIDLLSADNPALADVITKLEGVATNLGAITADVESTIPDTPTP